MGRGGDWREEALRTARGRESCSTTASSASSCLNPPDIVRSREGERRIPPPGGYRLSGTSMGGGGGCSDGKRPKILPPDQFLWEPLERGARERLRDRLACVLRVGDSAWKSTLASGLLTDAAADAGYQVRREITRRIDARFEELEELRFFPDKGAAEEVGARRQGGGGEATTIFEWRSPSPWVLLALVITNLPLFSDETLWTLVEALGGQTCPVQLYELFLRLVNSRLSQTERYQEDIRDLVEREAVFRHLAGGDLRALEAEHPELRKEAHELHRWCVQTLLCAEERPSSSSSSAPSSASAARPVPPNKVTSVRVLSAEPSSSSLEQEESSAEEDEPAPPGVPEGLTLPFLSTVYPDSSTPSELVDPETELRRPPKTSNAGAAGASQPGSEEHNLLLSNNVSAAEHQLNQVQVSSRYSKATGRSGQGKTRSSKNVAEQGEKVELKEAKRRMLGSSTVGDEVPEDVYILQGELLRSDFAGGKFDGMPLEIRGPWLALKRLITHGGDDNSAPTAGSAFSGTGASTTPSAASGSCAEIDLLLDAVRPSLEHCRERQPRRPPASGAGGGRKKSRASSRALPPSVSSGAAAHSAVPGSAAETGSARDEPSPRESEASSLSLSDTGEESEEEEDREATPSVEVVPSPSPGCWQDEPSAKRHKATTSSSSSSSGGAVRESTADCARISDGEPRAKRHREGSSGAEDAEVADPGESAPMSGSGRKSSSSTSGGGGGGRRRGGDARRRHSGSLENAGEGTRPSSSREPSGRALRGGRDSNNKNMSSTVERPAPPPFLGAKRGQPFRSRLVHPIFVPSAARAGKALLNYRAPHAFGSEQEDYVQVVVVEPHDYPLYARAFPHILFLILPRDGEGIGFSRYVIQRFVSNARLFFPAPPGQGVSIFYQAVYLSSLGLARSHTLGFVRRGEGCLCHQRLQSYFLCLSQEGAPLWEATYRRDFVWVLDDQLVRFYYSDREDEKAKRQPRQACPFRDALLGVQNHPNVAKFGVAGFLRDNGAATLRMRAWNEAAFKVYKAILLNVRKCDEHQVFFVPSMRMFEDLIFLYKVIAANMLVLKALTYYYVAPTASKGGCHAQREQSAAHEVITKEKLCPNFAELDAKDRDMVLVIFHWVSRQEKKYLDRLEDESIIELIRARIADRDAGPAPSLTAAAAASE